MFTVNIIKEIFFSFIHEYFGDMPEILFFISVERVMLAQLQIVLEYEYQGAFSTSLFYTSFLPAYYGRILSSFKPESQF